MSDRNQNPRTRQREGVCTFVARISTADGTVRATDVNAVPMEMRLVKQMSMLMPETRGDASRWISDARSQTRERGRTAAAVAAAAAAAVTATTVEVEPLDNPGNPHREKPIYEKRKGEERLPYGTFYERPSPGNASYVDGIQWKIKRDSSARSGNFPYFIKLQRDNRLYAHILSNGIPNLGDSARNFIARYRAGVSRSAREYFYCVRKFGGYSHLGLCAINFGNDIFFDGEKS